MLEAQPFIETMGILAYRILGQLYPLTGRGSSSMINEAVQTRADMSGQGIGAAMIEFAIAEAKGRGIGR
ncbi:hypothetical protein ACC710_38085, partial [Rhizobium ruizarguesonis]